MNKKILKIVASVCALLVVAFMFSGCTALTGTGSTASTGGTAQQSSPWTFIIMIVVLVAVFYFFMIRPENKRKKKVQEMRSGLGVGDDIVTIGGMLGKIVEMSDDSVTFETGEDRVRVKIAKWGISKKTK